MPLAQKELVNKALDDLVSNDIITPVQFSDYASPIVPVLKKDNSIRICVDFKQLNTQLDVEKYPLPRLDDILSVVGNNSFFCKLDLDQAYLQMCVAPKDQKYLVISTEKGLFKFNRLPFGLASAPAIFQRFIGQLLNNIEGVIVYLDDILICSPNKDIQLKRLKIVLSRLNNANVKLNVNKCIIDVDKLQFLGYVLSGDGVSPSKEKVRAIMEAPVPQNVSELQSFIGLITYYSRFIHKFSEILAPLYDLISKNVKFIWSAKCDASYKHVKKCISESKLLTCFKGNCNLILEADASPNGVGAVLIQVENNFERPLAFASKRLSAAERNYSQTDKEALALVFAVKKFRFYLLGRHFILKTDHRPLLGIFGRGKCIPTNANARLIRWSILLSQYNYDLVFKSGKSNVVADALSRLPMCSESDSDSPAEYIKMVQDLSFQNYSFNDICKLTKEDFVLKILINYLKFGWPKQDNICGEFSKIKNDLSLYEGAVLFRNRVIIPSKLRKEILDILHIGHNGILAMKEEARKTIFWPNISLDIEEKVKNCNNCSVNNFQKCLPKLQWPQSNKVWERIHIDYCGPVDNKYFLILVDSCSKFIDVHICNNMTSSSTIEFLRKSFSNFGIPSIIVSDNAQYFVSDEIKIFYKNNRIRLLNPAPYHPASNGLAERAVQTFKDGLKKFKSGSLMTRVSRFLYNYRRTIHSVTKKSPANMMFGRDFSSPINFSFDQNVIDSSMPTDNSSKFNINQAVFARNFGRGEKWLPGIIVDVKGLRNYVVKIMSNSGEMLWRRHADQLKSRYNDSDIDLKSRNFEFNAIPITLNYNDNTFDSSGNSGSNITENYDPILSDAPIINDAPIVSDDPIIDNVPSSSSVVKSEVIDSPRRSRSGRVIKPPSRLNV